MAQQPERKQQIPRYLLGGMAEEEREEFEQDYFDRDDLAAELLSAEEQWMEDYVSGRLNPEQRKQFESVYLTTGAQRNELRLFESLRHVSGAMKSMDPIFWTPVRKAVAAGLAACIVFLSFGLMILMRENRQLREEFNRVQAAHQQLLEQQPALSKKSPPPSSESPVPIETGTPLPAIVLLPGVREAASPAPVLHIPRNATALLLQVDVRSSAKTYQATIETVEGAVLFEAAPLRGIARGDGYARIQVPVPSNQLDSGDYILVIKNAGQFYFRIVKQ